MKYIIILILALLITSCAKTEEIEPIEQKPMFGNTINQLDYPANQPSTDNYQYLCWGTKEEEIWGGYRSWIAEAWVLNEGEVATSFTEVGAIPVE